MNNEIQDEIEFKIDDDSNKSEDSFSESQDSPFQELSKQIIESPNKFEIRSSDEYPRRFHSSKEMVTDAQEFFQRANPQIRFDHLPEASQKSEKKKKIIDHKFNAPKKEYRKKVYEDIEKPEPPNFDQ